MWAVNWFYTSVVIPPASITAARDETANMGMEQLDWSLVDVKEEFDLTLDHQGRMDVYNRKWTKVLEARERIAKQQAKLPTVRQLYAGRSVFMTGASGFVGRVIVEDVLRICPELDKVYIVLRDKKGVSAKDRLKALTDVALFDQLKKEQPNFVDKVVVLPGDCSELGLGLSEEHRRLLQEEVSFVFHCAASVRFDDPVNKAVLLNLRGTRELVDLCRGMKQLKALIHVSTAYTFTDQDPMLEKVYPTPLDWRTVIRAVETCNADHLDCLGHLLLGYQPNTYTWSKAMSEQIISEASNDLPITIIRPSIVCASIRRPVPGWVDNFNGFGGFGAGIMKGVLRVILVDGNCPRDMIPVDINADCAVVMSWIVATGQKFSDYEGAPVVNVACGEVNWQTTRDLMNLCDITNKRAPFPGGVRYPFVFPTTNNLLYQVTFFFYHILFALVVDTALRICGEKPMLMKIYRRMSLAVHALHYFNRRFRFSTLHVYRASALFHPEDQEYFDVDFCDSLRNYEKVGCDQISGISLYALRDKPSNPGEAKKHINRLFWAEVTWHCVVVFCVAWMLMKRLCVN